MHTRRCANASLISCPVDYPQSEAGTRHDQRYLFVGKIYDAVSLRNDWVRFFYYGQFNEHHMTTRNPVLLKKPGF